MLCLGVQLLMDCLDELRRKLFCKTNSMIQSLLADNKLA